METIRRNTTKSDSVVLLQNLLIKAGYDISADGDFGPITEAAVKDFQKKNKLVVDGIVGQKTWRTLLSEEPEDPLALKSRFLSEKDLQTVAEDLGVELAVVKAVNEVESSGQGFLGDKPKILFEGHILWRQLKKHGLDPKDHVAGNEDVLYSSWTREHYIGGQSEHLRLDKAKKIHENAALESASWGLFQIMGFHWENLGYKSVKDFVRLMNKSEGEHLKAFGRFVVANNLTKYLKNKEWANFARRYNGPGYKTNKYDEKLARAYQKYKI
ncbi:MAG: N-acetylmuramidase family protein [Thermodesulfobacteriota bacterium]